MRTSEQGNARQRNREGRRRQRHRHGHGHGQTQLESGAQNKNRRRVRGYQATGNRESNSWGTGREAHLEQEDCTEPTEDGSRLVVDSMNADNMDSRTEGNEDHSGDWLKEVELVAHVERELCVEERDGWEGKFSPQK